MTSTVDWSLLGGSVLGDVLSAEDLGPDFGDRYEVQHVLGEGGQGVVYQVWDRVLERSVAVKSMRDPGMSQRPLLEEARLLGRLAHPAIPQLYDRGRGPNGGVYVVMQLIEGQRLDRYLKEQPFNLAQRLHLFRAIAGAVDHAHRRGLLHRDLKPENIVVTAEGEPYLLDWGLAAHGGPRAICGSPYFAAPEQLQGQVADRRCDVYALGILLYVVLTDQLPFSRTVASFDEFRRQRAAMITVPLRQRRPEAPKALQRVIDIATASQPAARYQDVKKFVDDLDASEGGRPLARDLPRMPWRRAAQVAVISLAVAMGWLVGAWFSPAASVPESSLALTATNSQAAPHADILAATDGTRFGSIEQSVGPQSGSVEALLTPADISWDFTSATDIQATDGQASLPEIIRVPDVDLHAGSHATQGGSPVQTNLASRDIFAEVPDFTEPWWWRQHPQPRYLNADRLAEASDVTDGIAGQADEGDGAQISDRSAGTDFPALSWSALPELSELATPEMAGAATLPLEPLSDSRVQESEQPVDPAQGGQDDQPAESTALPPAVFHLPQVTVP